MSRQSPASYLVLAVVMAASLGCRPHQPFYFLEDGDLSHYIDMATDIEYPDVDSDTLGEVDGAIPPLTLSNTEPKEVWDLTLEEAVRIALENSKVIRSLGTGSLSSVESLKHNTGATDYLLRYPDGAATVYDPARFESNPNGGVEAALSAFATKFTTDVFWEKNHVPRNINPILEAVAYPRRFRQDLGDFQAQFAKTAATGGTWMLRHKILYEWNNGTRNFPSDWEAMVEAEFRQPLLQGNGVQFNRIAGPGAVPGQCNGVVIARLNTDIKLADFEAQVRDMVMDVEKTYWALYLAYRELDAMVAGRDSALQTWRKVHALYEVSARGGEAEKEAQAREQYFLFRSHVETELSNLYEVENKLRYMMGLAATDGRLIRPADEPTTARVSFDWYEAHGESLARNVSIRRQKWQVKKTEMELIAAKNYLLPRLDAVGLYRWRGLGDHLFPGPAVPGEADMNNAYANLTGGKYQSWHLGLNLTVPLGFRKELSGVRHAQLNLARERAMLQEEELELSHQLANAFRSLDRHYVLLQTNFNRRAAAEKQVDAVAAAYETETVTLDLLLDAQRRLAQAELAMYGSLTEYAVSIAQVHFRKGSLLEYNGVYLAEGPWPGKAYFDAHRRARQRDASIYLDYGFTRPKVLSRGPYAQNAGQHQLPFGEGPFGEGPFSEDDVLYDVLEGGEPVETRPEQIPTPAPDVPMEPSILPEQTPAVPLPPEEAGADHKPADGPKLDAAGNSAVRPASYQQVGPAIFAGNSRLSSQGWKSVNRSSTPHEPSTNPSPAQVDWSASGWTGIQR